MNAEEENKSKGLSRGSRSSPSKNIKRVKDIKDLLDDQNHSKKRSLKIKSRSLSWQEKQTY